MDTFNDLLEAIDDLAKDAAGINDTADNICSLTWLHEELNTLGVKAHKLAAIAENTKDSLEEIENI